MGYVLFMNTHRAHACERACERARVVKHSLIFGRILFKFAGNILQMTTVYMGYIFIIFTHRGHAYERAFASASVVKRSVIYERILFQFAVNILQITTSSTCFSCSRTARTRASVRVRVRAWLNIHLSLDGFYSNVLGTY
jgi:hypothetical protein